MDTEVKVVLIVLSMTTALILGIVAVCELGKYKTKSLFVENGFTQVMVENVGPMWVKE